MTPGERKYSRRVQALSGRMADGARACRLGMPARIGTALPLFLGAISMASAGPLRLTPSIEYGAQHSSNIFSASGSDARGDTIQHANIGVLADWQAASQDITVNAQVSRYQYQRFSQLDHDEHDASIAWKYVIGPIISGTASYSDQRYLEDFANRDSQQPNFVERRAPVIETFLAITPDWRIRTQAGYLQLDKSLSSERRFDRQEVQGTLELQYAGGPGSVAGVGNEVIRGRYPGRQPDDPLAQTFLQNTPFLRLDWHYSGVSQLQARAGYTQRDNSGGNSRDFGGVTGRLAYARTISAQTKLTAEAYREIYSVDDVAANYERDTGARLTLDWSYGPNIVLNAQLGRRNEDYPVFIGRDERRDVVDDLTGELTFTPVRNLALVFNISAVRRHSNVGGESYKGYVGGAAIRISLDPPPR